MSEEFKPGDFVQHKLGGEVMAVKKMNGERIRTWVDVDNSVRKESFTAADLRVVEDRKD